MSNLPAPIDPNLLPAYQSGGSAAYAQDLLLAEASLEISASAVFTAAIPALHPLRLFLPPEGGILALTEGGTPVGKVVCPGQEILQRLLEGGKALEGRFLPPTGISIWLKDL